VGLIFHVDTNLTRQLYKQQQGLGQVQLDL